MRQTIMEIACNTASFLSTTGLLQLLVRGPVGQGELEEMPQGDGALERIVGQGNTGADDLEHAMQTTTGGDRDQEGVMSEPGRSAFVIAELPHGL